MHPLTSVIDTEYVPADVTVIHCVVAPVFHEYDDAPEGAHKLVNEPSQNVLLPVMTQTGGFLALIVLLHVLVHPIEFVIVTVKVPAVFTVIHCVVAPVFHE